MLAAFVILAQLPVPVVTQSTPYNCGPACLTSVLRFYGAKCFEGEIAVAVRCDPQHGTTPGPMAEYARTCGFKAVARRDMKLSALRRSIAAGHPVIVSVTFPGGGGHYVTVVECSGTITYLDPWDGKSVSLSRRQFRCVWDRWGLILRPRETRDR